MTAEDLLKLENRYKREFKKTKIMAEVDNRFIMLVAEKASIYPLNFFISLPIREFAKVKGEILPFLMSAD
jgi:hypothetical protein